MDEGGAPSSKRTPSPHRGGKGGHSPSGLSCPFVVFPQAGADDGGSSGKAPKPCSYCPASDDDLEAHVLDMHWEQAEALGESLAKVARFHPQSGTYVCPIREVPPGLTGGTDLGHSGHQHHGGIPAREGVHSGRGGNLCCSAREMARHLQV